MSIYHKKYLGLGIENLRYCLVIISYLIILLIITLDVTIVSAEETLKVTIGQDTIFTTCNFHNYETAVAPFHPGKLPPNILNAYAKEQQAFCEVKATTNQEGTAKAWVGVFFSVETNTEGKQSQEAEVSITIDYCVAADFNVALPQYGGGGSTHARCEAFIDGALVDREEIPFAHYSNHDLKSEIKTVTRKILPRSRKELHGSGAYLCYGRYLCSRTCTYAI